MSQVQSATLGRPPKNRTCARSVRMTPERREQARAIRRPGESLEDWIDRVVKEEYDRAQLSKELPVLPSASEHCVVSSEEMPKRTAPTPERIATTLRVVSDPNRTAASDLWRVVAPSVKARVNGDQDNFEIWLSSVRFLGAEGDQLQLSAPNTFFVEYLTEHYAEVIQEELHAATGQHYEVKFIEAPEVPQETTQEEESPIVIEAPKSEPQTEDDLIALWLEEDKAIWVVRNEEDLTLASAKHLSFTAQSRMGKSIDARRAIEDKERAAKRSQARAALLARLSPALLHQPGPSHTHRQYEDRSAWGPEDGATRAKLKEAERACKPTHQRPKRDSS